MRTRNPDWTQQWLAIFPFVLSLEKSHRYIYQQRIEKTPLSSSKVLTDSSFRVRRLHDAFSLATGFLHQPIWPVLFLCWSAIPRACLSAGNSVPGQGKQRPSLTIRETRLGSRKEGSGRGGQWHRAPAPPVSEEKTGAKGACPKQVSKCSRH
jgi:hypothetical protein